MSANFTGPVEVKMTSAVVGATIRYTLDGSAPTATSTLYAGPISVTRSQTLKAMTVRTGYASSAIKSEEYQVGPSSIGVFPETDFHMSVRGNGSEVMLSVESPAAYVHLRIFDLAGKLVREMNAGQGSTMLPLHGIEPGMYVLRVEGPGIKRRRLIEVF